MYWRPVDASKDALPFLFFCPSRCCPNGCVLQLPTCTLELTRVVNVPHDGCQNCKMGVGMAVSPASKPSGRKPRYFAFLPTSGRACRPVFLPCIQSAVASSTGNTSRETASDSVSHEPKRHSKSKLVISPWVERHFKHVLKQFLVFSSQVQVPWQFPIFQVFQVGRHPVHQSLGEHLWLLSDVHKA